ncbi:tRNA 2'-phosphotransferase 1 [Nasonia vitripennis]|uniref:2'-phosphotransferase n=1 Tax=Nasonia vitripennis TaxID=7425 RepID=A0A7M7TD65_NASVI|nr:tRNA 2'-phosphotransferase 1 [Nasonia vitripennis]
MKLIFCAFIFKKADVVDHDKRISKKLSYLLRHAAVKKGFNIRPDGFIPVQEILKETPGCTVKDIERVVANNDKQRFTLSSFDNVLMIKANQGHTISQVDSLNLKLLDSVDFDIVHGTYHSCYEKIRHQGLSRMKRNHIHFAKGLNFINGLRRNAELFIFINYPKAKGDGLKFYKSENNVILCPGNSEGFVKTKYFLKVVTRSGESL